MRPLSIDSCTRQKAPRPIYPTDRLAESVFAELHVRNLSKNASHASNRLVTALADPECDRNLLGVLGSSQLLGGRYNLPSLPRSLT